MSLSNKLRQIRHELRWTQEKAALECGISYSIWRKLEAEEAQNPSINTLIKILTRYNEALFLRVKHEGKGIDWLTDFYPNWGVRL